MDAVFPTINFFTFLNSTKMKPIAFLSLVLVFFISCKKEQDEAQTGFEANEALILPSSIAYFIADVEGLQGVSKINLQTDGLPYCDVYPFCSAISWWAPCPVNFKGFATAVQNRLTVDSSQQVSISFMYPCAAECPVNELIPTGTTGFYAPTAFDGGGEVTFFQGQLSHTTLFYSFDQDNTGAGSSMEIVSLVEKPYQASSHEITLRFNATLGVQGSSQTIKFKNAVYRGYIGPR